MTLQAFFDLLSAHPAWILAFFILLPMTALLLGWIAKGAEYESPWSYAYSTLIYLACVPGIFAVTLSVYVFVFERRSIFQTDIYTQVLPIVSMIATLLIIRRTVDLDSIPGFDKITGLIVVIFAVFSIFWVLDKTHIWVVSYLPFWQGVLIFIGLLIAIRYGWTKMVKRG
ncbi:MAG: hypothetical protein H6577_03870 [Lewinellaceae bacterium]|nr:hypothetical protein [Saprospiraceae bacterium]MCB9337241.1 hypothetical protein [Lewinellaceae bacterium]